MIIQSISLLDQLDKDINTFSMRVREWYGYHFPELVKIINDNATYCRIAQFIGNRRELNEEKLEKLEELTMDGAKAKAILDASRASMGMDISAIDLINIESFSSRVVSLSEYRQSLHTYLRSKMSQVAPSLSALIGEAVRHGKRKTGGVRNGTVCFHTAVFPDPLCFPHMHLMGRGEARLCSWWVGESSFFD
ncbi:NOP56 ribonucleoprotein [Phyllostomus discolor]|nr:NOP56 ribonucleoprotein [Phyllostomus discolor]